MFKHFMFLGLGLAQEDILIPIVDTNNLEYVFKTYLNSGSD
jgi:hypothetical protein